MAPNLHDEGVKTFLGKRAISRAKTSSISFSSSRRAPTSSRASSTASSGARTSPRNSRTSSAASLRQNKYEISPFLEQVFLSKDFYSPATYGTQIKSPVQLVVSTYRSSASPPRRPILNFRPDRRAGADDLHSAERQRMGRRESVDESCHHVPARECGALHCLPGGDAGISQCSTSKAPRTSPET